MTLRGSILEDAVASTGRHGTVRGLPFKEILEQVVPELNVSCLRLALSTPKVTEQLLKQDEQGVSLVSVFAFFPLSSAVKQLIPAAVMPVFRLPLKEIQEVYLLSQPVYLVKLLKSK